MINYEIRDAEPSDSAALNMFLYQANLDTYANEAANILPEDLYSLAPTEQLIQGAEAYLAKKNPGHKMLVAVRGDEIIGGAQMVRRSPEEADELRILYVAKQHKRSGIGSALLQTACASFEPARATKLDVVQFNHEAIAFYVKHGFALDESQVVAPREIGNGKLLPRYRMVREARP